MAGPSSSERRKKLAGWLTTARPKFIKTSSGLVNSATGEILTSPRQQEFNKLTNVQPAFSRAKGVSSMNVKPVTTAPKSRPSGRDIARQKATGDIYAENVQDRPTGRAREAYYLKYVFPERIRKHNKSMIEAGRTDEVLPTSGKEYERNMRKMMLDYKSRFPGMGLDESNIMHVVPKASGGKNTWSNLRLGPSKLNWDQATAHPSAFRQLPADESQRFGSLGYGTGSSWEGIPEEGDTRPRTEINPRTGLRRPAGPVRGLPGVASMLLEPAVLAAVAAVSPNIDMRDAWELFKSRYRLQSPSDFKPRVDA
jgi:hypothetical protein